MDDILLLILLAIPVIFMLSDPPSKEWLAQQENDTKKIKSFFNHIFKKKSK